MGWSEPESWAAAVALSAAFAIWGRSPTRLLVHYTFKPLTIILIIGALGVLSHSPSSDLRVWVFAALCASLIGDLLLMLDERFFVSGLVAFLAAHILYTIGFGRQVVWSFDLLLYLPLIIAIAFGVLRFLWPGLGKLRAAVTLYVGAISLMTFMVLARVDTDGISGASAAWGVAGGFLFMLGDSLLAARRFRKMAVPYAIELGVYFAAQFCLATTVWTA